MQTLIKKAIILAGGNGSRLKPITKATSKQLLSIYDKPMIYYPISLIMLLGIKEILIITNSKFLKNYKLLLGNGNKFGINIKYKTQNKSNGIPEALKLGKNFLKKETFILLLGDNIFFGHGLVDLINNSIKKNNGCSIFTYTVNNPENFGVLKISKTKKIYKIIEKPKKFISNLAITGLYIFDNKCHDYYKKIKPSNRGELEIVSILNLYLKDAKLQHSTLTRGIMWFDTGTFESLLDANNLIFNTQKNNNKFIGSIEEIAYLNRWINKRQFKKIANYYNNEYGNNLKKISQ
jgi:glucose-1-phosphate thymidylyltransferase